MSTAPSHKHLLDWDEADVHQWFSELGFVHYERQIRENNLRGDSICLLDAEALKAMGVSTVGQRLSILRAIYELKISHKIEFEEDDYIPPSEVTASISIDDIHSSIKDQGERIRVLEEDTRTINNAMRAFLDEITRLRTSMGLPAEENIRKQIPYLRSDVEAIGRAALGSTAASVHQQESPSQPSNSLQTSSTSSTPPPRSSNTDTTDTNKVSLDDPTSKVLPAALKKHRIRIDEWPNYAMLITYGPPTNRTKRLLEQNEKPLWLFKKYKEAKMNPAFVLKNMKEQRTAGIDNSSRESLSDSPHLRAYPTPNSSFLN